jgi:TRAP-type transport system periplasmic protein
MGETMTMTLRRSRCLAALLAAALVLPTPALAQQKVTLKLNLGTPPGNPYNVGAEAFKKIVETDTKGAVTVQIFPMAQLGGETESAKNVQLGTLEATIVSTSNLASFNDKLSAFSVPYIFKSVSCSFPVVDGPVGQEMSDQLLKSAHIRVLGYPTFGARHLINTKRRVIHPDDLKGLKIRAPDPLLEATWRALGANPTPLPFPEVFNALQQGVIDGDANPLTSIQTFRWYEAAKYVSFTNTAVGIGVLIINDAFFNKLPKAQQDVIVKAAAESIKANRASEAELNKKAEAFLRTQGVTFDTPNQDEFRAKLTPVFEDAKKHFGAGLLDRIAAAQKGC